MTCAKAEQVFGALSVCALVWVLVEAWIASSKSLEIARPLWMNHLGGDPDSFTTRCLFNLGCLGDYLGGVGTAYPLLPLVVVSVPLFGWMFTLLGRPGKTKKEPGEASFAKDEELASLKAPGNPKKKLNSRGT